QGADTVAVSGRRTTFRTCQARRAMNRVRIRAKSRRERTQRSNPAPRRARRYGVGTTETRPGTFHATPRRNIPRPRAPAPLAAADAVGGESDAADPVDDAVGQVRARGDLVVVPHGWARNREPHFERTSARSSGVIVVSPRPRA